MKLCRHRYRVSLFVIPHFYCVKCDKTTFKPWWPLWKERK